MTSEYNFGPPELMKNYLMRQMRIEQSIIKARQGATVLFVTSKHSPLSEADTKRLLDAGVRISCGDDNLCGTTSGRILFDYIGDDNNQENAEEWQQEYGASFVKFDKEKV